MKKTLTMKEIWCNKKLVFCPPASALRDSLGSPRIAHICKSYKLTHKPKFAKEFNFANAPQFWLNFYLIKWS